MVIYERVEGTTDLVRAYSDQGLKIAKDDGIPYDEAIDPDYMNRVYHELDEPIDSIAEDNEEISAEDALALITGEENHD